MLKIKIDVVRNGAELLFKYGNVMFDQLDAYDFFEHGKLTVMRDGLVFDETANICAYGTHTASMCFSGLQKINSPKGSTRYTFNSRLVPEYFQEKDEIILEFEAPIGFNFEMELRISAMFLRVTIDAFKQKKPLNFKELQEKVGEGIGALSNDYMNAEILRFRERKSA